MGVVKAVEVGGGVADRGDSVVRTGSRVRRGEADIVVGSRSALFAPVRRPGLVILDEEHEPSYRQDNNPRYHAREVALWWGQLARAPVHAARPGTAVAALEMRIGIQDALLQLAGRKKVQVSRLEFVHFTL